MEFDKIIFFHSLICPILSNYIVKKESTLKLQNFTLICLLIRISVLSNVYVYKVLFNLINMFIGVISQVKGIF